MERFDIVISGAGIAGLVAAAGLAARGFSVCIVDPARPVEDASHDASDLRSTAYLQPARDLFERVGLWPLLAPEAVPLNALLVIDSTGDPPLERARRRFEPGNLGLPCFGWNLPNWRCRAILAAHLARRPGVDLRLGTGFVAMLARDDEVRVRLDDGERVSARLLIGADGRESPVARAAGIGARVRRYGQSALAFAATHETPHENVSAEIYRSGGAFTTVPMADQDGAPASAIVWMDDGPAAAAIAALPAGAFDAAMTRRSLGVLGAMRRLTPVRPWPVITRTADRLTGRRLALIAEAAHVLPPIGAQGLNTSLADVAALLACLGDDPGAPAGLEAYVRARGRDIAVRTAAIDLFNRICQSDMPVIQALRLAGLRASHDIAPLRRGIMRAGLGAAHQGTQDSRF